VDEQSLAELAELGRKAFFDIDQIERIQKRDCYHFPHGVRVTELILRRTKSSQDGVPTGNAFSKSYIFRRWTLPGHLMAGQPAFKVSQLH
jgi:hypothetical protein